MSSSVPSRLGVSSQSHRTRDELSFNSATGGSCRRESDTLIFSDNDDNVDERRLSAGRDTAEPSGSVTGNTSTGSSLKGSDTCRPTSKDSEGPDPVRPTPPSTANLALVHSSTHTDPPYKTGPGCGRWRLTRAPGASDTRPRHAGLALPLLYQRSHHAEEEGLQYPSSDGRLLSIGYRPHQRAVTARQPSKQSGVGRELVEQQVFPAQPPSERRKVTSAPRIAALGLLWDCNSANDGTTRPYAQRRRGGSPQRYAPPPQQKSETPPEAAVSKQEITPQVTEVDSQEQQRPPSPVEWKPMRPTNSTDSIAPEEAKPERRRSKVEVSISTVRNNDVTNSISSSPQTNPTSTTSPQSTLSTTSDIKLFEGLSTLGIDASELSFEHLRTLNVVRRAARRWRGMTTRSSQVGNVMIRRGSVVPFSAGEGHDRRLQRQKSGTKGLLDTLSSFAGSVSSFCNEPEQPEVLYATYVDSVSFSVQMYGTSGRARVVLTKFSLLIQLDVAGATLEYPLRSVAEITPSSDGSCLTLTISDRITDENIGKPTAAQLAEDPHLKIHSQNATLMAFRIAQARSELFQARIAAVDSRAVQPRGASNARTVHIVHFNDVYELSPVSCEGLVGGAARFLTKLEEIREKRVPLVLFSGDFIGPSLMSIVTKGQHMRDAFNLIGVHYGCLGNHEFDFGIKSLKGAIFGYTKGTHVSVGSTARWIMSNITGDDGEPIAATLKWHICCVEGIHVGLLGLAENWIGKCPQLKKGEAFYHDFIHTGEKMARELKKRGAEVVVAMTHSEYENDLLLSEGAPSIDLILGGHDHSFRLKPHKRIVKSGHDFKYLSEIELDVASKALKVDVHPITSDIPPHAGMETLINRYNNKLADTMGQPVARADISLDGREEVVRYKEGHLTNFITDIVQEESGADCAVIGGAAFGASSELPAGSTVTAGDIFRWLPNSPKIMVVRMSGKTLVKLLSVMCADCPGEAQSFPHPSSQLTFTIDVTTSPAVAKEVKIAGTPVADDSMFTVALEDFAAMAKSKYKFLATEATVVLDYEASQYVTTWLMQHFRTQNRIIRRRGGKRFMSTLDRGTVGRSIVGMNFSFTAAIMNVTKKSFSPDNYGDDDSDDDSDSGSPSLRNVRFSNFAAHLPYSEVFKLINVCAVIAEQVSASKTLDAVMLAVPNLLNCSGARLYHVDRASKSLVDAKDGRRVGKKGVAWCTFVGAKPLMVNDTSQDGDFDPETDAIGHATRTLISVPIFSRNKVCGILQCYNKLRKGCKDPVGPDLELGESELRDSEEDDEDQPTFSTKDMYSALVIAVQLSTYVRMVLAKESLKQEESAVQMILGTVRQFTSDVHIALPDLVHQLSECAKVVFKCERAQLFLVHDPEDQDSMLNNVALSPLEMSVSGGSRSTATSPKSRTSNQQSHSSTDSSTTSGVAMWSAVRGANDKLRVFRTPLGLGVAVRVATSGEPMNLQNPYASPYFNASADKSNKTKTESLLCLPLIKSDQESVVGVLQLANKNSSVFSAQDVEFGKDFCEFLVAALEHVEEVASLKRDGSDINLAGVPVKRLNRITVQQGVLRATQEQDSGNTPPESSIMMWNTEFKSFGELL